MAKRYVPGVLLLLHFSFHVIAQVTITNSIFPVVGDTLRYSLDLSPAGDPNSYITPPGGNQNWDFTNLRAQQTNTIIYRNPGSGMQSSQFPGAELLVIGNNRESYYNITNNRVELLGFTGADPINLGINLSATYAPPIVEQRVPIQFFDINQISSGLLLPFSIEAVPSAITNLLPVRPDSLRIRVATNRLDVVNAWGSLAIPGGTYQVLREKRTTYRETRLDAKVPPLGWLDITDVAIQSLRLTELGVDTTVSYHFFSNTAKEQIAILTLDGNESSVVSAQYKANRLNTPVTRVSPTPLELVLFPNPASEKLQLTAHSMESGRYQLKIYTLLGQEVWSETHQVSGKKWETALDVSSLPTGTYWCQLIDSQGFIRAKNQLLVVD